VRVPRSLRALERRCNAAFEDLSRRLECEPTVAQLAAEMQQPCAAIDEVRALRSQAPAVRRDGIRLNAGEALELEPDRVAAAYEGDDFLSLGVALRSLSDRELRIIRGIYFQERTQVSVGDELGISQRQVSRLLQRALERLAGLMAVPVP
jgi:RNA polymerase sigma-B factor